MIDIFWTGVRIFKVLIREKFIWQTENVKSLLLPGLGGATDEFRIASDRRVTIRQEGTKQVTSLQNLDVVLNTIRIVKHT